jgi:hypothetical protein
MDMWSDDFLDQMRRCGDPLADGAIAEVARSGQVAAVNDLLVSLVRNRGRPPAALPRVIRDYLQKTEGVPAPDVPLIQKGEELFGLYGPEILLALGLYSLPYTYANRRGVQVVHRTAYLRDRALRRLFETMQLVIDVLGPGGLSPDGAGVRSAQKVRLLHAAIRAQLLSDEARPWDPALGVPINQEDLAMTLMAFSTIVLDSLEALRIEVSRADQEAYLRTWTAIGRILGIVEELLPADLDQARALTQRIFRRHVGACREGAEMTAPLLSAMALLLPSPFLHGLPASMCRYYFQRGPLHDARVPELLQVPPADWTRVLVQATVAYGRVRGLVSRAPDAAPLIRLVSRPMCEALLFIGRGPDRAQFSIPPTLQERWRRRPFRQRKPWPTFSSSALGV